VSWLTILAQAVNFLILVALLRRFLFRPVIRLMDQREADIRKRLSAAEQSRVSAEAKVRELEAARRELEDHRHEMRDEAERVVEGWREAELREARAEIERAKARWRESLAREQIELMEELRDRVGRLVTTAMQRSLSELADTALETQTVTVFLRRLEKLDPSERDQLARASAASEPAVVQSALALSPNDRGRLDEAIRRCFPPERPIEFVVLPDLLCGVTVQIGGYTVGWNLRDVLRQLDEEFGMGLREEAAARAEAGS
jgi:F-type H+-transporting ATPase subunit b